MTSFPSTVRVISAPRLDVEANDLRPIFNATSEFPIAPTPKSKETALLCGVCVDATTFPSNPVEVGRETVDTRRNMAAPRRILESTATTTVRVGGEPAEVVEDRE